MTISDFWYSAFIAALTLLPAEEAKHEADRTTNLAVDHWDKTKKDWGQVVPVLTSYADLDITDIRQPAQRRL